MNGAYNSTFFWPAPWSPEEGSKGQISYSFNYKDTFKDFSITKIVCVLTNKRYKTYQTGFSFYHLGYTPGVGFWGAQGVKKLEHGHVAYQIDRDGEHKRMQCFFSS